MGRPARKWMLFAAGGSDLREAMMRRVIKMMPLVLRTARWMVAE